MKKILLIAILATFATGAMAAPTVYGLINKEIRYIKQDKEAERSTMATASDIGAVPTRLGVKGTVDTKDGLDLNYKLEMGFISTDVGSSSGIGVRLAQVDLVMENMGTLTVGQAYTATALAALVADPLTSTGANLLGTGNSWDDVDSAETYVGYYTRLRKDLIGYKTPEFAGFQLNVTYDKNDTINREIDAGNGTGTAGKHEPTFYEALLTYKNSFGDTKLTLHAGHIKRVGSKDQYTRFETSMFGGVLSHQGFSLSAFYTLQGFTIAAQKANRTYTMLGAKYAWNKHYIAANYGSRVKEDGEKNTGDIEDWSTQTQIGLGYGYMLTKMVTLTGTGMMTKIETDGDAAAADKKAYNNDAMTLMAGVKLVF